MDKFIQAGKFKAECLHIMDAVKASGKEVIITKHKVPIARLCPMPKEKIKLFGRMRGTVHVNGDIINPIGEEWDADC